MNTKFRKFLSYLLVLMLICSNLSVPALAEEVTDPVNTLTLPAALQVIEAEAFCGNTSIGRVVVPEGTTTIQSRAFADSSLTEIVLPQSLSSIADDAFSGCGEFTVSAAKGSYAYDWAVGKGYIIPSAFTTEVLADGTLAITGYTGADGDIVIPAEIDGVPVTKIGESAFANNKVINHVTIPEGVTAIGAYAFNFSTLTGIDLPQSLTTLEQGAFCSATSLTEIEIPASVTVLPDQCFSSCTSLTSAPLPDTLTTISYDTFFNCPSLTELIIPASVTSIRNTSFEDCGALLKCYAGSYAHEWLLENAESCFLTYEIITSATPEEYFETEMLGNGTLAITGYTGADTDVVIPGTIGGVQVTEIGDSAFEDGHLTSVVIPEGVTSIGSYAFGWNRSLTSVKLPSTLRELGAYCFNQCQLSEITLPEGLVTISDGAFGGNGLITSIHIPASVTYIGESVFYDWYSLESFTIASGNTAYKLVDGVLLSSDGSVLLLDLQHKTRTAYTVPDGVTRIGGDAFANAINLTEIILPESLESIGGSAFLCCTSLQSIDLPAGCTSLGGNVFELCTSLREITLPEGLHRLDWAAFAGCSSLETVVLPQSIRQIDDYALADCSSLKSIALPDNISFIGDCAFDGSNQIVATVSSGSYAHCWCLDHGVAVSYGYDATPAADFEYDVINDEMIVITGYTGTDSEIVVPDRIDGLPVLELSDNAFAGNTALTKAVLLHGVQVIGSGAFSGCTALTEVVLPETVLVLSDSAFAGCSALTGLNLPESMATIELSAFDGCANLVVTVIAGSYAANFCSQYGIPLKYKEVYYDESSFRYYVTEENTVVITDFVSPSVSMKIPATIDGIQVVGIDSEAFMYRFFTDVTLPEGLTFIGSDAFYGCDMSSISLPSTLRSIGSYAFANCSNLTEIDLPEGLETLGSGAFSYCASLRSIVIPGSVEQIPGHLSSNCENLTEITLSEGITSIGDNAFSYCAALEQINLPESLLEIGSYAFSNCTSLTSLTIPAGVTAISGNPFRYCAALTSVNVAAGSESFTAADGMLYTKDMTCLIGCIPTVEGRVVVPDGVASLAPGAFASCSNLTAIVLPATISEMSWSCFENCGATVWVHANSYAADWCRSNNIPYAYVDSAEGDFTYTVLEDGTAAVTGYTGTNATAVIPAQLGGMNVTAIAADAFSGLGYLTGAVIPEGVASIGDRAFANGPTHLAISLPRSLNSIGDSVFLGVGSFAFTVHPGTYAEQWCIDNGFAYTQAGAEYLHHTIGEDGNATITGYYGRDREFTIPATLYGHPVTALSDYAFSGNSYLTRVNIPSTLVSIPGGAFSSCSRLTDFSVDEANPVYSFMDGVLYSKDGSTLMLFPFGRSGEFTVPAGVTAIGDSAFDRIETLTQINLPEGLVSIGERGLYGTGITSLYLPDSVTELGERALSANENLASVRLSESLTTLSEYVFCYCPSLKEIVIPDSVTRIEHYAFGESYNLKNVSLGSGLTYIGEDAFYCCDLRSIEIPEGVTVIDTAAFSENTSLTQISLPDSLTTIAGSAFYLTSLKSIEIPAGVTEIGSAAFSLCEDLQEFIVAEANTAYCDIDGVLFTGDGSTLVAFPAAKTGSYTMPAGVVTIGRAAFNHCYELKSVVAPEGLKTIEFLAFANCDSLTSVSLPASVESIDDDAFSNSSSVIITAPEGSYALEWATVNGFIVENVVLESSHPYEDDMNQTWYYTHEEPAYALAVTFSKKTGFEDGIDYLYITDSEGNEEYYTGSQLSGRTLILPGNSFSLRLRTDESVTEFGFRITEVRALSEEEFLRDYLFDTEELEDGTLAITGVNSQIPDLVIPAEINGRRVTVIADGALASNQHFLESVVISEGITAIGNSAFSGNTSLTSVSIPSTVVTIGDYAFSACAFSTAVIPEGVVSIGYRAFENCLNMISISLPSTLTYLGEHAFQNCPALTSINIPAGIGSIRNYMFNGSVSLTSVVIPEGITSLGYWSFAYCGNLTSVSLPASLEYIDDSAFYNSPSLIITAPEGSYAWQWGIERGYIEEPSVIESDHPYADNADQTWGYVDDAPAYALVLTFSSKTYLEAGCDWLFITGSDGVENGYSSYALSGQTIVVPGNSFTLRLTSDGSVNGFGFRITKIQALTEEEYLNYGEFTYSPLEDGTIAVTGFTGFRPDIEIPSEIDGMKVTRVESGSFANSTSLTSVIIPEGVTSIGNHAFNCCQNLSRIELPSSLTEIGFGVFFDCSSLTEITIPDGVTAIGFETFYSCDQLAAVTLPAGLTEIGYSAFYNCGSLNSISIPDGVTAIGHSAFDGCRSLTSIHLPASLSAIEQSLFQNCNNLGEVNIPAGVESIGAYAFRGCWPLAELVLPDSVTYIGEFAFESCYTLTELTIPGSVTEISRYAFYSCYGMTALTVEEGVQTIGEWAFGGCYALEAVSLPASVSFIDDYAFQNSNLITITAPEDSYAWQWAADRNLQYEEPIIESAHPYAPNTDETYTHTADSGDVYAHLIRFSRNTYFTNGDWLTITDGEGNSKDYWGDNLRGRTICIKGNSFTMTLHSDDMDEEYGFAVVSIVPMTEEELLNTGEFTYQTLEDGTAAITGFTGYRPDLTIPSEIGGLPVTAIYYSAFYDNDYLESVVIPEGVTTIMDNAFQSCDNLISVQLPSTLTEIQYSAFNACYALSSINLPEGLSTIGSYGLAANSSYLTELTLPSTLTQIGEYAFAWNYGLTEITIPGSLTEISRYAFYNCNRLKEVTVEEGVQTIGEWTFGDCYALETVSLPGSVSFIDDTAFQNGNLITIHAPEGSCAWQWAVDRNLQYEEPIIESAHPYAPNTEMAWTHTADSEDVYAHLVKFSRDTRFTSGDWLTITDGEGNFKDYWWDDLRGKTICIKGNSFTMTLHSDDMDEEYGFAVVSIVPMTEEELLNTGEFTYQTLEDGTAAVTGFTGFRPDLTIPSEIGGLPVTAVYSGAFSDNDHLESVVIPEGVTTVMDAAFSDCNNLTSVQLPSTLTEIQSSVFNCCYALSSINLPEGLTTVGSHALCTNGSGLTELTIPSTLTQTGEYAFACNYGLTELTIPGSLTEISRYAFYNCNRLKEVTVEEGVQTIGEWAFGDCHALETAVLPGSITFIDDTAFQNDNLITITAPEDSYAWQWAVDRNLQYEEPIIESAHPYEPNSEETFTHTAESEGVYAHLVTFSRNTYFSNGDWLTVTDGEGNSKDYGWDSLRGKTICVKGNSFTMTLHSDDIDEEYGFAVVSIVPMTEEEFLNYGEFTYQTLEDGTAAVTGFTGFRPDLTIPSEIGGLPVTAVSYNAFYDNDHLESVVVPEGVTTIMNNAFQSCDNLISVQLPSTLTGIQGSAFNSCYALSSINLPEGLTTVGSYALCTYSYSLTELTLPSTLTQMDEYAFAWNYSLTELTIPGSLTEISRYAFHNCNRLKEVTVEEGVQTIGEWAFGDISSLETVTLPGSITFIDDSAFQNDSRVTITAPEGSCAWQWAADRNLLYEEPIIESAHPYAPNTETTWTHTADSEDVYAQLVTFSRNTYFENGDWLNVTDAEGSVKGYSYGQLAGKTICVKGNSFSLTLHSDEYDEGYGFAVVSIVPMTEEELLNYGEFTYQTLEDGTAAITGFTGFRPDLTIPSEIDGLPVTAISYTAFYDNDHLESVVIPEGVTSVMTGAFQSIDNLSSVHLPSTLTEIQNSAFNSCYALSSINLPEGLTTIGSHGLASNSSYLTELTLPSTLTQVGEYAFAWNYGLTEITIPGSLTEISRYAFYNCNRLKEVTVEEGVQTIGEWAFGDISSLETVTLPGSITFIDDSAFQNDSRVTITAPEGSYAWQWVVDRNLQSEEAIIESAHPYAPNTDETYTHTADSGDVYAHLIRFSRNTYFENGDWLNITDAEGSVKGYSYGQLSGKTIAVKGNSFSLTMHSDEYDEGYGFAVVSIVPMTEEEFLNTGEFTYQTLEDGTAAITGFTGFRPDLTIPSEIDGLPVTAISYTAFYDNDHLESVVIPEGVTSIMYSAFNGCDSLSSVQLPSTLTEIQNSAFYSCYALREVNFPEGLTTIGDFAFSAYTSYLTEITLPSTLTQIGEHAFSYNHGLTELTIPGSISEITGFAFFNCTTLKHITVEEGVQSIDEYAFSACYALETVTLPGSITFIDDSAFQNASSVTITAPEGSYAYDWAQSRGLLAE